MRLIGNAEFTIIETPDQLEFIVVRQRGWAGYVLGPAVLLALAVWAASTGQELFAIFAIFFGGLSFFADWANGRVTRLRVTKDALAARGNLGQMLTTEILILAPDVLSIGYEAGGEGDSIGLHVRTSWTCTLVLPGFNQEECVTVTEAIARRFPEIHLQNNSPGLFFGADSGITTLGLSSPQNRPNLE